VQQLDLRRALDNIRTEQPRQQPSKVRYIAEGKRG
jgi:hypothetical protein